MIAQTHDPQRVQRIDDRRAQRAERVFATFRLRTQLVIPKRVLLVRVVRVHHRVAHGVATWNVRHDANEPAAVGNGAVSRTWGSPHTQATVRSRPSPKPACGTEP